MYKIRSEAEDRIYECDLQFAVYRNEIYGEGKIYAASFIGRPSPVQAISAGLMMGLSRHFTITTPDAKDYVTCGDVRVATDRIGDVLHAILMPKESSHIIIAPDGDLDKALTAWVCSRFAVPSEFDYTKVIKYEELKTVINPECPQWKNLRAWQIDGVNGLFLSRIDEETLLKGIEEALQDGRLAIPPSPVDGIFEPDMTLQEYLKANARVFAEKLNHVKPLHSLEEENLDPSIVMERIPFPIQAHTIQSLVKALKHQDTAILCGDMGTGKSIVSLGISNTIYNKRNKKPTRVLLSAPGITLPKWDEQEIGETLPNAKVEIIRSTDDAARYLKKARKNDLPDGLNFVLIGIDRAKLGPDPYCAALWKPIREIEDGKAVQREYAWHCPQCAQWLPDPRVKKEEGEMPAGWTLFVSEPYQDGMFTLNGTPRGKIRWNLPAKLKNCPHCHSPLWRPALKSRGETRNRPRWYPADILKRLGKHFHLYIADEVHQTKAQDSGRGFAFAQMVKASKKTLALTGTLLNGMSTSVKEILWRTDPASLLKQGFDHKTGMVEWASRYGVLERVIRTTDDDQGINTRRKRVAKQPKEKPGIAPELVATHLLHKSAFIELQDLGLPIVDLKEIPIFVELDREHKDEYDMFHDRLYNVCKQAYAKGIKGAFSRFIPSTINAVDRADLSQDVLIDDSPIRFDGFDPSYYNAKERELVSTVKDNLAEDRGCVIYTYYTDRYKINSRLQKVLKDHGIEAEILQGTSPDKRFEWLQNAEKRAVKVIITNLRLVEVGLDLLAWPSLIFYQGSYDINSVRQSSRRAWRIGQTRECRVYYMIADGTQQVSQFQSCMLKRAHAMMAEGRLDRSELAKYGRDTTSALAADLAECLADEDLGTKWTELAAKDMDIETIPEDQFQEVLRKTQKALADETLRLCGLQDEIEDDVETEIPKSSSWVDIYVVPRRRRKKKQLQGQVSLFDLLKEDCG
jgi:superfamily II DNA or RNA helicase/ssDNA-binding Zn-finger/Zn-ribbon topoisomerase 1